jgi:hypothetical protein
MKNRQAIILIPGHGAEVRGEARRRLARGVVAAFEGGEIKAPSEEAQVNPDGPLTLIAKVRTRTTTVDIFEAYWLDLIPPRGNLGPLSNLTAGFRLLGYWCNFRMLSAVRGSLYMTLGLVSSGLLLLAWYYGVIVLALTAVKSDPTILPKLFGSDQPLVASLSAKLGEWGVSLGSWKVWGLVSFLLAFTPTNALVAIASFARSYLLNLETHDQPGLRHLIRKRVLDTIHAVHNNPEYAHVTLVAHSFGTIIALDILADYVPASDAATLDVVTMGSPAYVLSRRSSWLKREIKRSRAANCYEKWVDFYSQEDWLCGKVPGGEKGRHRACELNLDAGLIERLTGRTHQLYYSRQEIAMELLAKPSVETPPTEVKTVGAGFGRGDTDKEVRPAEG